MNINRFFLGMLIINILLFNLVFMALIIHEEIISSVPSYLIYILLVIGIIGIITNVYNSFPKEKK